MIVDTSVFMTIILDESEAERFRLALRAGRDNAMSAGSWIELAAVMTRRRIDGWAAADKIVKRFAITIVPVSRDQAIVGAQAYRRYGIGSNHAAKLNFGDCFAYALAMDRGEPLLFKGDDFSRTDVQTASY